MASIDSLYELYYLSAYEFNSRCKSAIQAVYSSYRIETPFYFFEFFLSQPLPLNKDLSPRQKGDVWVLAPFAPRMAEHSPVVPQITRHGAPHKYRTSTSWKNLRLNFKWVDSVFAKDCYNYLAKAAAKKRHGKVNVEFSQHPNGVSRERFSVGRVDGWSLDWQGKSYKNAGTPSGRALLKLYRQLFVTKKENVPCMLVPIYSQNLYYGAIWIMMPEASPGDIKQQFQEVVGVHIAKFIQDCYVPPLAVLHQYWSEKLLNDMLKPYRSDPTKLLSSLPAGGKLDTMDIEGPDLRTITYFNPFMIGTDYLGETSAAILETAFHELWSSRGSIGECERLRKNLLFSQYIVSSDKMIHLLLKVIRCAMLLRKSGDTLPACLVVGGAGSGKDKLAKLLKLFSETYRGGPEYIINMASIRPGPLTSALMVGVQPSVKAGAKLYEGLEVKGMLQRIREEHHKLADDLAPTLILDEFNSMDPDSQGVLLRFLDNSEIISLGAIEDAEGKGKKTDCLIIGVMNENPDDISRERAMEFFKNDSYLGNFIGDVIYEHFMKIRRLRPDIKYRMIRNGKFVIPPLRDRGEDIPMLFHVFVRSELESMFESRALAKNKLDIHLPLDVLNRLMCKDLFWPGNVRQLQALAKNVAAKLYELNGATDSYVVKLHDLELALAQVELVSVRETFNTYD